MNFRLDMYREHFVKYQIIFAQSLSGNSSSFKDKFWELVTGNFIEICF